MNRQFEQITAIYTRVDSGKYDMEAAISQQKTALSEYAQGHGVTNIRIYSDCGFSAFDDTRPAFVKLETDIRSGKVAVLILFDLTRLCWYGRGQGYVPVWPELSGGWTLYGGKFYPLLPEEGRRDARRVPQRPGLSGTWI